MIPWIQVYSNLPQHPKTFKLAEELKITSSFVSANVEAVGVLVSLWTWAIQNAYDGDLSGCSAATIADACRWKKKPETLVNALISAGYVDEDMRLHDWEEYAELLIASQDSKKEKDRERAKRYRDKKRDESVTERDASRDAERDASQKSSVTERDNHASTIPYHTIHNHTVPEDSNNSIYLSKNESGKKPIDYAKLAQAFHRLGKEEEAKRNGELAIAAGIPLNLETYMVE